MEDALWRLTQQSRTLQDFRKDISGVLAENHIRAVQGIIWRAKTDENGDGENNAACKANGNYAET